MTVGESYATHTTFDTVYESSIITNTGQRDVDPKRLMPRPTRKVLEQHRIDWLVQKTGTAIFLEQGRRRI